MNIRTRFAPSPTGYLHIGGVRTALFNWLLARRHGGQFILRIDDTDAERNREEALQPILDGFRWLGMDWDEGPDVGGPCGPYFQSQRNHLYVEAARRLLAAGHAYPDYTPPEEAEKARKAAKGNYIHRGANRTADPAENERLYREKPAPLRLKVPEGRTVVVDDLIKGRVEVQTATLGDPVILRADGRALYNFATVVDDAALRITHVIRAAEHLSNTVPQTLMYEALDLQPPRFAHVPVVNWKGKKMSKRDLPPLTEDEKIRLRMGGWTDQQIAERTDLNLATVAYYRELGYLPQALVNYLGRLGWSLDDHSEFIPLKLMTENFSLDRVNSSPGEFDPKKLFWLEDEYMKLLSAEDRFAACLPFLRRAGLIGDPVTDAQRETVIKVIRACGDRLKVFSDILPYGAPFLRPDPVYDEQAFQKRLRTGAGAGLLRGFLPDLEAVEPFETGPLETALHAYCERHGAKGGDLIHALRIGATGVQVGPGVYDCLAILGKAESLRRLGMALARI